MSKLKVVLSTARLDVLLDLLAEQPKVSLYTMFPIARVMEASKPNKRGEVLITTDIGTIRTHISQTGHFLVCPEEMLIPLSSVADPSYTARLQRFEEGQGLTWEE